MIVLDEDLLALRLNNPITGWYPGRVCYITDLHPSVLIKDEAIPQLLQRTKGATFVTTNVADFWRHVPAHMRYGIVCLLLPNERLSMVPQLLRRLFHLPEFSTKATRMGKVIRVSQRQIQYYSVGDKHIRTLTWRDDRF